MNPQSLNRYSYVYNSPLRYIDPNGHHPLVLALIGAIIGAGMAGIQSDGDGDAMLKGAIIGAISSAVGYYVGLELGPLIGGSTKLGVAVAGGAAGGMAAGAISAALSGSNVLKGMMIGAVTGAIGGYVGYHMSEANPVPAAAAKNDGSCLTTAQDVLPTNAKEAEILTDATRHGELMYVTTKDVDGTKWAQLDMKAKTPGTGCHKCFDLFEGSENCIKFDDSTLHIRNYGALGKIVYHYDGYNIATDFWRHLWYDTIYFLPQDLGLVRSLQIYK